MSDMPGGKVNKFSASDQGDTAEQRKWEMPDGTDKTQNAKKDE